MLYKTFIVHRLNGGFKLRYIKFIINRYRAIEAPLKIDIIKNALLPMIGVNECGKTTILNAIFAFDHFNDELNNDGRHLKDNNNLYRTEDVASEVLAEIEIDWFNFELILELVKKKYKTKSHIKLYEGLRDKFPSTIIISRNLTTLDYSILDANFKNKKLNDALARQIINRLPYILYFDEFRDSIDDMIEITNKKDASSWLKTIEQLFISTNIGFSVYDLPNKEERKRDTILARVEKKLNSTLTKEWQTFRLDEHDALKIKLTYISNNDHKYLKFNIVEIDANGEEYYFYIKDRSKGFYWFFNFVMKLEFNPKIAGDMENPTTIYLLDEPGSYLHSSAQSRLCNKLKHISEKNTVIYCTHSHYLLNPEIIPLNIIRIVEKENNSITLKSIYDYKGSIVDKRSAFQPILDALHAKPFMFENMNNHVLIVEGIYDFYALHLFKTDSNITIIPAANAESIRYYISLMIAWGIEYYALWDNDNEGKKAKEKAEIFFGTEEAKKFFLLPINDNKHKKILQDLFADSDLKLIRIELNLPKETSFEKKILSLYFSSERDRIIESISQETKNNFAIIFRLIGERSKIYLTG